MRRLVVVSGAPASGKSTVAAALAAELGWPLLAVDTVKETLADDLGTGRDLGLGDEDWSLRLGHAAAEVVFRLARDVPAAVVEGWWRRERRDRALQEFAGAAVEVFCRCDPALSLARARHRMETDRHPIHRDRMNPSLWDGFEQYVAAVPPLGVARALVVVDTGQDGAVPAAAAQVRAALDLRPSQE